MSRYKQLAYEQRCQIKVLKKRGLCQSAIAESVGVSQSTISRELTRNIGKRGYRHKQAQNKSDERRQTAHKALKMTARVRSESILRPSILLLGAGVEREYERLTQAVLAKEHGLQNCFT